MPVIGFGAGIALAKRVTGFRTDPFGAFNFHVEIDGLIVGGFSEVSGLSIETEVERKREGGVNDSEHVYFKSSKAADIQLKRGMADVDQLYGWYAEVAKGKIKRKNGTIYLLDNAGTPITWWDFFESFPIKWTGPTLNAESTAVATESITLVVQRIERSREARLAGTIRSVAGGLAGL